MISSIRMSVFTVLVFASTACAPQITRCEFVRLLPKPGLTITHYAHTNAECFRIIKSMPIRYELQRDQYTIIFAIGDRWYPQLVLDVHGRQGQPLTLKCPAIYFASELVMRGERFRYYVREQEAPNSVLVFKVLDSFGKEISVESIPFKLDRATTISIDAV